MTNAATRLLDRIGRREAVVGVVGLGYVGLPLSLTFARRGVPVIGLDTDNAKIETLLAGRSYLRHLDVDDLRALVTEHLFTPTADYARAAECFEVPARESWRPRELPGTSSDRACRCRPRPGVTAEG